MAVHEEVYMHRKHVYEEHAYVLDYLPYGRSSEKSRHLVVPTAQIMGERYFTLLEAELKVGATVAVPERIYIGRDRREKVDRIISTSWSSGRALVPNVFAITETGSATPIA